VKGKPVFQPFLFKEIAVAIYWQTKSAKGSSVEPSHTDWINVQGLSFGTTRPISTKTGRIADRNPSRGQIGEVHISKEMDKASVDLFMSTCLGDGEPMEIHVTRPGSRADGSEIVYLKYQLENALVTGYSMNSTGNTPGETLTVNFTKMTMIHTPQDAAAKGTEPVPVTFNNASGESEGGS
jgi:type VI secretion system secreted protein Hcp